MPTRLGRERLKATAAVNGIWKTWSEDIFPPRPCAYPEIAQMAWLGFLFLLYRVWFHPTTLDPREKTIWTKLGSNPDPFALQATALSKTPWLPGKSFSRWNFFSGTFVTWSHWNGSSPIYSHGPTIFQACSELFNSLLRSLSLSLSLSHSHSLSLSRTLSHKYIGTNQLVKIQPLSDTKEDSFWKFWKRKTWFILFPRYFECWRKKLTLL